MKVEDVCLPGEIVRQSRIILAIQLASALAVLVAAAVWSAWPLLWAFATVYPIALVCNMIRFFYWRGFDPFIWKEAESGRFKAMAAWNGLTMLLDWLLNVLPLGVGAYIVTALVDGSSVPRAFAWLALSLCIYPIRFKVPRNRRFLQDRFASTLFVLTLGVAAASCFLNVTPFFVTVVGLALTAVVVPLEFVLSMPRMKGEYAKMLDEASRGLVRRQTWSSSWFPRKGVIFEPQYNSYTKVNVSMFMEIQPSLTVLRVNWCGAILSLALLVWGAWHVAAAGRSALLLVVPVLALFGLFFGAMTSVADRRDDCRDVDGARGILTLMQMAAIAVPMLWWGGHDLAKLLSLGALFAAGWFFIFGFVIRATSRGVFDTLEFLMTLAALGAVVAARVFLGCVWWEALLALCAFAFAYPYLRARFLRHDLPEVKEDKPTTGPSDDGAAVSAKKNRRDRKRERQMGAFRRSQGGSRA